MKGEIIEKQRKVIAQLQAELRVMKESRQQFAHEHERAVGIITNLKASAEQLQKENTHIAAQAHGILKWAIFECGGKIVLNDVNIPRVSQFVMQREDRGEGRDARRIYTLRDMTDEERKSYEEARNDLRPTQEEEQTDGQEG